MQHLLAPIEQVKISWIFARIEIIIPEHQFAVLVDLKLAAFNAFAKGFHEAQLSRSFFHFSQNLYMKVPDLSLQMLYESNHELDVTLKMFALVLTNVKVLANRIT